MDRRDEAGEKRTVDTVKGDTHDALDEAKHRVQAGAEKVRADFDETTRDVRDDAI